MTRPCAHCRSGSGQVRQSAASTARWTRVPRPWVAKPAAAAARTAPSRNLAADGGRGWGLGPAGDPVGEEMEVQRVSLAERTSGGSGGQEKRPGQDQ